MVPLEKHEEIREALRINRIVEMILATDADFERLAKLVDFVSVADSEHLLVFSFLMRIISYKWSEFLGILSVLKQVDMDSIGLFHQLTRTVDRFIVDGSVIRQGCLRDCLAVEHVLSTFLISFVNKEHILELLDADVPRVYRFCGAHDGGSCFISDENVSLLISRNLLDVLIIDD